MISGIDVDGPDDGDVIVLLHGIASSRNTYHEIMPLLVEAGWRVINVDLLGHGDAPRSSAYGSRDYAAGVLEVLRRLDVESAILVGHSLGGVTAAAVAHMAPDVVRGLFLEDPPLFKGDPAERAAGPAADGFPEFVAKIRKWQASSASIVEIAADYGAQSWPHGGTALERMGKAVIDMRATSLQRFDPEAMDAAISGETFADFEPTAPLRCPVIVLAADPLLGAVFRPEHSERFLAAVPHGHVETAPGQAHGIHEDPEGVHLYTEALFRFLQSMA